MSLASVFNIAGTGMSAQSTRLNTISSNIANAEAVSSSIDQTYRARHPVFATVFDSTMQGDRGSLFADQDQAGRGVQVLGVVEDLEQPDAALRAQPPGGGRERRPVYYPYVNVVEEMADMISASRRLPDQRGNDEYRQADDAARADPGPVSGERGARR